MRRILLLFGIILFCGIRLTDANKEDILQKLFPPEKESNRRMTILDTWQNLENKMKDISKQAIKIIMSVVVKNYDKVNVSQKCMSQSFHVLMGLKDLKPWALRFVDSSGKTVDGLLEGSLTAFGSYDECIDTEVKSTRLSDNGKLLFRGQYCTIEAFPPLPPKKDFFKMEDIPEELKPLTHSNSIIGEIAKYANSLYFVSLRAGVCVPSGCSQEDINNIVSKFGDIFSVNVQASRCEVKKDNEFTPLVKAIISCYSFVIFLMLIGTFIDVYSYYSKIVCERTFIRVLLVFSLYTNFRKFIHTGASSETISCLDGVRFLGMSWIILGHTYFYINFQVINIFFRIEDLAKNFAFQAVSNGTVAVDTFFFIGGLLVCFRTVKLERFQGYRFRIWTYVVRRLWRIIPVYIFVLLLPFTVNLFGSGPVWHETVEGQYETCYHNWWTHLLFINNFYNAENMCLDHTWYIAADFQLYLGSILILIPILRKPKIGILLAIFIILSSIVYSGIGTYIYHYPPTMLLSRPDFEQMIFFTSRFYYRPFVHAAPYSLGLIAGYILATKPDLKIPPRVQILGWSLAIITNMSVLYGVHGWNSGRESPLWVSLLYASVFRTAWSLGVAWMIVCCATGHGGIINYILSWKVFVPLGRLSYAAYLTHPIFQLYYMGNMRNSVQFQHYTLVWLFLGSLCITYAASFCLSMLVEYPFMALEKIIFTSAEKRKNNSFVQEQNVFNRSISLEKYSTTAIITNCDVKTKDSSSGMNIK